jgi:hypothetical protein
MKSINRRVHKESAESAKKTILFAYMALPYEIRA